MTIEALDTILHWAAVLSLTTACLGVAIYLVTRVVRRPVLGHLLWMLLLAKLFFPPLVNLEIALPQPAPEVNDAQQTAAGQTAAGETPPASPPGLPNEVALPAEQPTEAALATLSPQDQEMSPAEFEAMLDEIALQQELASAAEPIAEPPQATATVGPPPVEIASAPAVAEISLPPVGWSFSGRLALVAIWLVGGLAVLGQLSLQTWRLRRAIRHASPISAELAGRWAEVCRQAGVANPPQALCVDGAISPLVVARLGRPVLVAPRELFARLSPDQQRLVLAHELAHIRRRDHWVRYLEAAAAVVYWWHPVVWLARAELRVAEEECCDQLVLQWYPESARTYGEALLDTVDFLAAAGGLAPAATGFVSQRILKQRLETIMDPSKRRATPRAAKWLLLILAAISLPVSARAVQQREMPTSQDAIKAEQVELAELAEQQAQQREEATAEARNRELEALAAERQNRARELETARAELQARQERLEAAKTDLEAQRREVENATRDMDGRSRASAAIQLNNRARELEAAQAQLQARQRERQAALARDRMSADAAPGGQTPGRELKTTQSQAQARTQAVEIELAEAQARARELEALADQWIPGRDNLGEALAEAQERQRVAESAMAEARNRELAIGVARQQERGADTMPEVEIDQGLDLDREIDLDLDAVGGQDRVSTPQREQQEISERIERLERLVEQLLQQLSNEDRDVTVPIPPPVAIPALPHVTPVEAAPARVVSPFAPSTIGSRFQNVERGFDPANRRRWEGLLYTVEIRSDGTIYVGRQRVSREEFPAHLRRSIALHDNEEPLAIDLSVAKETPIQQIADIMNLIHELNFDDVRLSVLESDSEQDNAAGR